MSWNVEFLANARSAFLGLPEKTRFQLAKKVAGLFENPFGIGAGKMKGYPDMYKLRVGDYRMVFRVNQRARHVEITRVGHRKDVYRGL